jgi:hypothetical protein
MIERVHEHIIEELRTNTRTDTIFVLTAIFLNLITLLVNSIVAQGGPTFTKNVVMFTFVALILVVNYVAEVGLIKGRQTREKLLDGLVKMYKDNGVEGYYDISLLGAYRTRYTLFMVTVLFTGLVALIIPFIVRGNL